jgi:DNA-binding Lrp family transcriptional regulator
METATMDDIDERLIALLREDSRTTNVQLAERIGTTEGTVRSRLKRLAEDGTIRSFTIRTASRNIKALVEVKIEVNVDTTEISRQIRDMPQVEAVYEVAGDADIVAVVDVMTVGELNTVIESIRSFGPTIATETRLVLNEL